MGWKEYAIALEEHLKHHTSDETKLRFHEKWMSENRKYFDTNRLNLFERIADNLNKHFEKHNVITKDDFEKLVVWSGLEASTNVTADELVSNKPDRMPDNSNYTEEELTED